MNLKFVPAREFNRSSCLAVRIMLELFENMSRAFYIISLLASECYLIRERVTTVTCDIILRRRSTRRDGHARHKAKSKIDSVCILHDQPLTPFIRGGLDARCKLCGGHLPLSVINHTRHKPSEALYDIYPCICYVNATILLELARFLTARDINQISAPAESNLNHIFV